MSTDRSSIHILSLVTNNAVGDSRVLKCSESLAAAGFKVTLLAGLIGKVPAAESTSGFSIVRVPISKRYAQKRQTPFFPFSYTVKIKHKYVRYGSRLIAPDILFWRWASPLLLKISSRFLYSAWPLLKDGEESYGSIIDQLAPDIIHANDCDTLGLALRAKKRAASKGRTIEVLYDAHEYVQGVHRKHPVWQKAMMMLESTSIQQVNSVMTVSEKIAEMLEDDYRLPVRPTVVLNAPRLEQPEVDAKMKTIRSKIGLSPEIPLHIYVGAAAPQRGLDAMIEALPFAPGHHVGLVVNPAAPYVQGLVEKAQQLGVADRLHLHPYVPEWYVSTFVSDATSGVIPIHHHLNHEISLVTKYFEYLHARLPIIVSDVRAMAAEVRLHGNGLVFSAGSAKELAIRFKEVSADRARFVAAITPEMLDEYSWEHQGVKLVNAHQALADAVISSRLGKKI
jgi:glycogen synthase